MLMLVFSLEIIMTVNDWRLWMKKSNIPLVLRLLDVFSIAVIVCSRMTEILEDHDSQLQCEDADEGLSNYLH